MNSNLKRGDIHIVKNKIHYGCNEENPLTKIGFYKNSNPNGSIKIEIYLTHKNNMSLIIMPKSFQQTYFRVYCSQPNKVV